MGEVHPDLPPVGSGDGEDRLAVDRHPPDLLPARLLDHEQLVPADRGQEDQVACHAPALEMRHLVDRQRLLAAAVAVEDAHGLGRRVPEIEQRHAVLAEEPGDVVAAVGRDQRIVGQRADIHEPPGDGRAILVEARRPDGIGVVEAEDEAVVRQVLEPHHLGPGAIGAIGRRDLAERGEVGRGEEADAARLVVGDRDHAAVLRDRTADAVAGLDDPMSDLGGQQVDTAQPAVAAEDEGVAGIAGEDHRGVAEIAQPLDPIDRPPLGRVDDQKRPVGALDDDAEVAGAAQLGSRGGDSDGQSKRRGQEHEPVNPHRRSPPEAARPARPPRPRAGARARAASACRARRPE
jgi:hypothetical protein